MKSSPPSIVLRPRVDLHLVANALRQLNDSAYFEPRLHEFTRHFVGAIQHVLDSPGLYDSAIEVHFARIGRSVQSYLSGSINNLTPYEVVYCLKDALTRWGLGDAVIATFLTEDHDFHLLPLDPWNFIEHSIAGYDAGGFKLVVAMIGVPRIYAHKPVFCLPLFHELGHFIDNRHKITYASLVQNPSFVAAPGTDIETEYNHRREYFADLFGASFAGRSSIAALETIAGAALASPTHPATVDRVVAVEAFLNGSSHPMIGMFAKALQARKLPPLQSVFSKVDVQPDFDDIRTFSPRTIEEAFGLLDAAWSYLFDAIDGHRNPWGLALVRDGDVEALTNDLTEKSIRNFAIRQAWNAAAAAP